MLRKLFLNTAMVFSKTINGFRLTLDTTMKMIPRIKMMMNNLKSKVTRNKSNRQVESESEVKGLNRLLENIQNTFT